MKKALMSVAALPMMFATYCERPHEPEPKDSAACAQARVEADALAPLHNYKDLGPVKAVINLIAPACFGWDPATTQVRAEWMAKVADRESGGCYNLRRGARFANHDGAGCLIGRQGHGSDSGYGQVLMSVHGKTMCAEWGLCTPDQVTASPSNSAIPFIDLVDRAGKQPWCYTAKLRRGAICQSWPG